MSLRRGNVRIPRALVAAVAGLLAAVVLVSLMPGVATALSIASRSTTSQARRARVLGSATRTMAGGSVDIPWPSTGRARIEVAGLGTMGSRGGSTVSVPIASITKVMAAYTILKDHPLAAGAKGPKIAITKADVRAAARLRKQGAAVVKVRAGTKLTQRQALQGLLVASAANLAVTLARWDAGSVSAFVDRMNANAAELGLDETRFDDPVGLSEDSRSSMIDLLDLAPKAMRIAAFRTIVAQTRVKIPLNTLTSTNKLLGKNGVIGIKTGTTYAAGGCLLFAATDRVDGRTRTIYGVMLGARGSAYSANAQKFSRKMIVAARSELRRVTLLRRGRAVASVTRANGRVDRYGVRRTLTVPGWSGLSYRLRLPSGLSAGQTPTRLIVTVGSRTMKVALTKL